MRFAPGWIATAPEHRALQDDPARAGPILARTPMDRFGTPEEIAAASALSRLTRRQLTLTGTILPVDGGYYARRLNDLEGKHHERQIGPPTATLSLPNLPRS